MNTPARFINNAGIAFLVLGFLVTALPFRLDARDRINYLHLKSFLRSYQERLQELAPRDEEALLSVNEHRFAQLFFAPDVPMYNFLGEQGSEQQTTLADFFVETRSFRSDHFILVDDIRFYLDDFEVVRERRNGLLTIRLTQLLTFRERYGRGVYSFLDNLYMTLLYTNRQDFKILRIDRADFAFADGLGSHLLLPSSISFEYAAQDQQFIDGFYLSDPFFNQAGFDVSLRFNYDMYGRNQYGLQLSAGLTYTSLKNALSTEQMNISIPIPADQDGDPFDLLISGHGFGHTLAIDYAGLPVELVSTWHRRPHHIRLGIGVEYLFPLRSSFIMNQGALTYAGRYRLEGYDILLEDLPQYGFTDYLQDAVSGIYSPSLKPQLKASVSLQYGFQWSPGLTLFAGPRVHYALTPVADPQEQTGLLQDPTAPMGPNLLAFGNQNGLLRIGFTLGLAYQLKRPNLPYRRHVSYSDVRSDLSRLRRRDLDQQHPPIHVYVINSHARIYADKAFDRNRFTDAVTEILARTLFDDRQHHLVYVAFDDSLFVKTDNQLDLRALQSVVYQPISEGSNFISQDFENFSAAIHEYPMSNRRVIFHMLLASPYSYRDALVFIERFGNEFLREDYRFAEFHIYSPILRFHERRISDFASQPEAGDPEDRNLQRLMQAIESGPTTPFNFDYRYERIILD